MRRPSFSRSVASLLVGSIVVASSVAGCGASASDEGANAASSIDSYGPGGVFTPTSFDVTLVSVHGASAQDVTQGQVDYYLNSQIPGGVNPYWTADSGYRLGASLAYRVNNADVSSTACDLGPINTGDTIGACVGTAYQVGPLTTGKPLTRQLTVSAPTDVVWIGVGLDNIEAHNPNSFTASAALPASGDALGTLGTIVSLAGDATAGGLLGVIGGALSILGDLSGGGDKDPRFEVTCAGGVMGTDSNGKRTDTLLQKFTPEELYRMTANGPATISYRAITNKQTDLCYAAFDVTMVIAREWGTGLAPSPKSPDSLVARTPSEIDQFMPSPAGTPTLDRQYSSGGAWQSQSITPDYSSAYSNASVAVLSRNEALDVFYNDAGVLYWSTMDANQTWSYRSQVSAPNLPANAQITAAARTGRNLDVFYIGTDGGVWTSYWWTDPSKPPQSWKPFELPGTAGLGQPGGGIAAVARTADSIDVFWTGYDQARRTTLYQSEWTAQTNQWITKNITPYQPNLAPLGAKLAATARTVNNLDVFFVGNDGSLYNAYWYGGAPAFVTFPIAGTAGLGRAGASVSAVSRQPMQLDVAFVGNYKIYVSSWSNGPWSTHVVSTNTASLDAPVAIAARTSWDLDIAYRDILNQLWETHWQYGMPSWPAPQGPIGRVCPAQPCGIGSAWSASQCTCVRLKLNL